MARTMPCKGSKKDHISSQNHDQMLKQPHAAPPLVGASRPSSIHLSSLLLTVYSTKPQPCPLLLIYPTRPQQDPTTRHTPTSLATSCHPALLGTPGSSCAPATRAATDSASACCCCWAARAPAAAAPAPEEEGPRPLLPEEPPAAVARVAWALPLLLGPRWSSASSRPAWGGRRGLISPCQQFRLQHLKRRMRHSLSANALPVFRKIDVFSRPGGG